MKLVKTVAVTTEQEVEQGEHEYLASLSSRFNTEPSFGHNGIKILERAFTELVFLSHLNGGVLGASFTNTNHRIAIIRDLLNQAEAQIRK